MQIYFVFAADYVGIGRKGQMIARMRDGGCADAIRARERRKQEHVTIKATTVHVEQNRCNVQKVG